MNLSNTNWIYDCTCEGENFTEEQRLACEEQFDNSHQLEDGLRLLAFYRRKPEFGDKRAAVILWMISNHPDSIVWRHTVPLYLLRDSNVEHISQVKERWLQCAAKEPDNAEVLGNAGVYLQNVDSDFAVPLIKRAAELEPTEKYWCNILSRFYFWKASTSEGDSKKAFAQEVLKFGLKYIELYGDYDKHGNALREKEIRRCMICAYWCDDFSLVKSLAKAHLKITQSWIGKPKVSRSMLGLLAVRTGYIAEAKKHLLYLPRKIFLDEFDLRLADELLKLGEVETVRRYFNKRRALGLFCANWRG